MEDFARIVASRDEAAVPVVLGAGVATAFGCTIAGKVDERIVLGLVETLIEAGAGEITIADTVGYANPAQVYGLMRKVMALADAVPVACHFHDTRGLGLANVMAAVDAGVRSMPRWAVSAVVRSRRTPRATSTPRTPCSCWRRRA